MSVEELIEDIVRDTHSKREIWNIVRNFGPKVGLTCYGAAGEWFTGPYAHDLAHDYAQVVADADAANGRVTACVMVYVIEWADDEEMNGSNITYVFASEEAVKAGTELALPND